jgi:low affinity Fe/Cu permease
VFLIQNTQNRDSHAVQLKLDELIRAVDGAHNALLDIEELTGEELDVLRKRYAALAARAREEIKRGHHDTDRPELEVD